MKAGYITLIQQHGQRLVTSHSCDLTLIQRDWMSIVVAEHTLKTTLTERFDNRTNWTNRTIMNKTNKVLQHYTLYIYI